MKKILIYLGILIAIILLFHVALFTFVNAKGKAIILASIKKNLGAEATLDSFALKFPFKVEAKGFNCKGISFKEANISIGPFNPFAYSLVLDKVSVEQLNLVLTKEKDSLDIGPFNLKKAISSKSDKVGGKTETVLVAELPKPKPKARALSLVVTELNLKDSAFEFVLLKGKKSTKSILEDINSTIRNITYPQLTKFYLKLVASLRTDKGTSKDVLAADGWIDYSAKNMNVNCNINSIKYSLLSGYYPQSWKPVNIGVTEATLTLDANLISKNNDLLVEGDLTLDRVEFTQEEESSRRDLVRTIIALMQGGKEKASLHIKLRTKMDSPKLNFSSIKENIPSIVPVISALVVEGLLGKTKETTTESINGAKDIVEDTLDTAIETIKGVVGAIGDIFIHLEEGSVQEQKQQK